MGGLFGALIVLESSKSRLLLKSALGVLLIVDNPGNQTLNLYEWNERSALGYYTLLKGRLGRFPSTLKTSRRVRLYAWNILVVPFAIN